LIFEYIADRILPAVVYQKKKSMIIVRGSGAIGCSRDRHESWRADKRTQRTWPGHDIKGGPAGDKTAAGSHQVGNQRPIQKGNERILIVDDQVSIVDIETQMLEYLGYHVTTCTGSLNCCKFLIFGRGERI